MRCREEKECTLGRRLSRPSTFRWTDQDLREHVPSRQANLARGRRVELDRGKHLRGSGQADRYRRTAATSVANKCPLWFGLNVRGQRGGGSPFGCERFWQILRGPLAHRRPTDRDRPIGGRGPSVGIVSGLLRRRAEGGPHDSDTSLGEPRRLFSVRQCSLQEAPSTRAGSAPMLSIF